MLNFLPALILVVILIIILALRSAKMQLGSIWLLLIILSLVNWGAVVFLRFHLPQPLVVLDWLPLISGNDPLSLGITENTWLLFFALAGLMSAILLNSSAHLHEKRIFPIWLEVLSLTAVGMVVLLAQSALSFLLMWGLIDFVEIIVFAIINRDHVIGIKTYAIFISRILGLSLVMLAVVMGYQNNIPLDLSTADAKILPLLVIGASLRLGVFPLHVPYTRELSQLRSVATVLRFIAPLSAFSFLSQLAAPEQISGIFLVVYLLAVLGSLIGSINWLLAKDELEGRPYWLLAFSCLAVISYFHKQPVSILVLGLIMVTIGGWIFLNEQKERRINILLPLVILTLSAVPFTPASISLLGISGGGLRVFNPLLWISLVVLVAGLLRFSMRPAESQPYIENWMKFFYAIGMGLLVLSNWIVLPLKVSGWNQLQTWPATITVILLLIFMSLLFVSENFRRRITGLKVYQYHQTLQPLARFLNKLFHFEWFFNLMGSLFNAQSAVIIGMNSILEGEGGILWALVFLALLLSLLVGGAGLNG